MSSEYIPVAKRFESSRVRKRFLSQIIPMTRLLSRYGFEITMTETLVSLKKSGLEFYVFVREGEQRYSRNDMIFLICDKRESQYHVAANQMSGILRTLVRWGALAQDEIPPHEIEETLDAARIQCAGCGDTEPMNQRFMQCKVCHERDRMHTLPEFKGFYCCVECQRRDWTRHKAEDH